MHRHLLLAICLFAPLLQAHAQVGGTTPPGPTTTPTLPSTPATPNTRPHVPITPGAVAALFNCNVVPDQVRGFLMNPHDINPQPSAFWIPQYGSGKRVAALGGNFDVMLPDLGYNGIWLSLADRGNYVAPFNELFSKFTPAELLSRNLVVASAGTTHACYVRVLLPNARVMPQMVPKYGGGAVESTYIDFNYLPLQAGYYYDVEVYSFSATAMTKVQSYRITFKTCPVTDNTRCP